jgi:hypothetical protein
VDQIQSLFKQKWKKRMNHLLNRQVRRKSIKLQSKQLNFKISKTRMRVRHKSVNVKKVLVK